MSGSSGSRRLAGKASEDRARRETGASGIVEVEEATDEFACCKEAVDGSEITVENVGGRVDAQATEREGDAAGDGVGLEGRLINGVGPVRLGDGQPFGGPSVPDIGVEGDVLPDGAIE